MNVEAAAGLATLERRRGGRQPRRCARRARMALEPTIVTECPPDGEFVELLEGRHPGPAAARLEQHLAACAACRALVDELKKGEIGLAQALAAVLGETLGRRASIGRYRVL